MSMEIHWNITRFGGIEFRRILVRSFWMLFFSFAFIFFLSLPPSETWAQGFRPATLNLISGKSPYAVDIVFNPPWAFVPLIPLAILPVHLGNALIGLVSLLSYALVGYRLKAHPVILFLFLTTPYVFASSNIDWMVALGILMPPWIGLFFVSTKPQLGLVIGVFWLAECYRIGGIKKVVVNFSPVVLAFIFSLVVFGMYPLRSTALLDAYHNLNLWPGGIPIGMVLLSIAIRRREMRFSLAAAPFTSPYIMAWSLPVSLLGFLPYTAEALAAIAGLWILDLVGAPWHFFLVLLKSSALFN